jgi:hypothetical protein
MPKVVTDHSIDYSVFYFLGVPKILLALGGLLVFRVLLISGVP